jgi:hypothetical protein
MFKEIEFDGAHCEIVAKGLRFSFDGLTMVSMSRGRVDLQKVLAALNKTCPNCGYRITPAEIRRVSWDEIECPH